MQENNRDFFNQLLERTLTNVCLWENFDDVSKRRIYELTGMQEEFEGKHKFEVQYLNGSVERSYKTIEEMSQDYVATPIDLMRIGKSMKNLAPITTKDTYIP